MTAEVDQSSRMISQLTQVRSKLFFKNVSLFLSVIFLEIEHFLKLSLLKFTNLTRDIDIPARIFSRVSKDLV